MYGFLRLTFLSVLSQPQLIRSYKHVNNIINYNRCVFSTLSNDNISQQSNDKKAEFKGRLIYINNSNKHLYNESLESLLDSDLLGLDTESPIALRSKGNLASLIDNQKPLNTSMPCPTVLQISGPDVCLVYNLKSMGIGPEDRLPESLVSLLTNPSITKVCHGNADFYLIKKYFGIECINTVDLYHVCVSINSKSRSLQGAVAIYMGLYLDKTLQKSNWDSENLTQDQIKYAATDAWISREFLISLRARYGLSRLPCEIPNKLKNDENEITINKDTELNISNNENTYKAFDDFNDCPFASLLNICLSKGYEFEFNNVEKSEHGIKSILSIDVFGDKFISKSVNWHSDIIEARRDAAQQLLEILKGKN